MARWCRMGAAAAGAACGAGWTAQAHADGGEDMFMSYRGKLYNAGPFAAVHPGGEELVKAAKGNDLERFFDVYTIHKDNPLVEGFLTGLEVHAAPGAHLSNGTVVEGNGRTWLWRRLRVCCVAACLPFWAALAAVRWFLRAWLWSAVPAPLARRQRVAVIGGGIAGCGAAYALSQSQGGGGFDVTVYEARGALGGNATTFEWAPGQTTGLAVLAWPTTYFRNYTKLLERLNVATEAVVLPYYINSSVEGYEGTYDQLGLDGNAGGPRDLRVTFADDLAKWERAVETVRHVGNVLCGDRHSLYKSSYLNPFNYVSLKTLLLKGYGCSEAFWDVVVVSQHGASFLTPELDAIPATILPTIDDLIPLQGLSGMTRITPMRTWAGTSEAVFERMTAQCTVKTGARVLSVDAAGDGGIPRHAVATADGGVEEYDAVVFACQASAAAAMLREKSWVEHALLNGVRYTDDSNLCWVKAEVHQDPSVLRPAHHADTLRQRYATYIDVSRDAARGDPATRGYHYEQTFVLGSWYPTLRGTGTTALVTHGRVPEKPIDPALYRSTATHVRAHPALDTWNLMISQLLRVVQGRRGVYFCGNYTTPGNGHDLSLLSGFVAAELAGAAYPFPEDAEAAKDFKELRALMVGA